ncbi:MAG TPA: UTP--glucose-1-phosphate uridylyltransferase [Spirochaetales bacterium]|nr:UTP--glucose-1-phosphate uridylyltransferase [Spirochaetales bacterium]
MAAPETRLSRALLADMAAKGVDAELSLSILDDYNAGLYDGVAPVRAAGVPAVDGRSVVELGPALSYALPEAEARERLAGLGLEAPAAARASGGSLSFGRAELKELGLALLSRTAYGILNGGSATSYADSKKNLAFGEAAFEAMRPSFESLAPLCKDRPKGLTPAFVNPDGSPGPSFLELKLRARLLLCRAYRERFGEPGRPVLPVYQMSSVGNDGQLREAYRGYESEPFLAEPAARAGEAPCDLATGVQPLIAAYSHSAEGRPKRVFDRAYGRPDSVVALPGGHGQCFRVLAPVLRALRGSEIRFAYLGNVDNLGYLPDPAELALLALSGLPAGFDFSLRTPMDVKGGILVEAADGSRTIADIGPAISFEEVRRLEAGGSTILFNCATGLFDLDWLVPRIEGLGRELPVRFTDQDKDAGRYSQAEQVTWEVASLLPGFLAFAVEKSERFIAAKLLAETLLTSGVARGDRRIPPELAATSRRLSEGLARKLEGAYGLELRGGRWEAAS